MLSAHIAFPPARAARAARAAPGLLAHAWGHKTLIFFQWVQNLGTLRYHLRLFSQSDSEEEEEGGDAGDGVEAESERVDPVTGKRLSEFGMMLKEFKHSSIIEEFKNDADIAAAAEAGVSVRGRSCVAQPACAPPPVLRSENVHALEGLACRKRVAPAS